MKFNSVAVAGTFDHLHLGHQKLLATAKTAGKKVLVGLCQKSMLTNKAFPQSLESFSIRRQAVAKFYPDQIIPLSDIYGPAATSSTINAIVCTPQTQTNVDKINRLRLKNKLPELKKILVSLVKDNSGQILSSTHIRQGLVNRQGLVYADLFRHNLTLPKSQRRYFQKPFSQIITTITSPKYFCIAVGDIAALSLLKEKITPNLAIVDLKTKRQTAFANLSSLGLKTGLFATNPPGHLTPDLAGKILTCLSKKIPTLLVDGEEDLAVLPAILLSPLKTEIFYGQPDLGLVKISVTEKTKTKALKLLEKFI
ncbi:MAG: pantetheine-phosphate adenylyltransferase [Candidatus Beckwithbacteria bacterium]|nr:pantetheine-phosphate adenylyltransferase [Candidatus Beckwithbacteria bacterium]